MASTSINLPLVVIVGPTASGKTNLAINLAKRFDGEIISADSRAVYKGMDIGTAKPTVSERAGVPHWGLDLVEPGEYFSVVDFKGYANQKIAEIRSRGRVPFLVGGTGLYVDAVLFDYQFGPPANTSMRSELQQKSLKELNELCYSYGIQLPENSKNKRYIIRSIEVNGQVPTKNSSPLSNSIIVGITTDIQVLRERIASRATVIFQSGVIDEAKNLSEKFGWESEAMKSNIYPLLHQYIDSLISLNQAIDCFKTIDWRLAKRQLTWMRRNKFIHWMPLSDAEKYISDQLAIVQ